MHILITGGAGFIGSHFAEACLAAGWSVDIIDDLSTGSMQNIAHLKPRRAFSYTIDTVFNERLVSELVDDCDIVFHLAAAVGVKLVVESPVCTIETNVRGTEVVLKAAAKKHKAVVIASTSEVYGKNSSVPYTEDADAVLGPTTIGRWSYACSKALDECLGFAYWNERKTPVCVVRFFNTVGPRQTGRYGMVLPTFVKQALTSKPITVYGTGEQTRCFAFVGDVVQALLRLAQSDRVWGEVLNIGNDEEISIMDLALLVKTMTGSSSPIVRVPYAEAYGPGFEDMYRRVPSVAKLERLLGVRPRTSLREIVERVIEDMRSTSTTELMQPAALAAAR
jgi:UDP-glucose 4-epimerase